MGSQQCEITVLNQVPCMFKVALRLTLKCDIYCLGASAEIKVKMVYLTSGYIKSKSEFENPSFMIIWICEYLCTLS